MSLTAAPVDGKANAALCRLLADALDVPLRAVRITRGELSPKKQVTVTGLDLAALEAALARAT